MSCFNTQPPEGGWGNAEGRTGGKPSFNTQPPEGGWLNTMIEKGKAGYVSTHSRLKAAGLLLYIYG